MIINSSHVGMDSERSYASKSKDATKKTTYSAGGKAEFSSLLLSSNSEKEYNGEMVDKKSTESYEEDNNEKNTALLSLQEHMDVLRNKIKNITSASNGGAMSVENDLRNKLASECLSYLLRLLFGRDFDDWISNSTNNQSCKNYISSESTSIEAQSLSASIVSYGSVYDEIHYFEEEEYTAFSTTGTVVTSDGREISFNLDLEMSRSFSEYTGIHKENLVQLVDPLVINLDGNIANVSDQKFYFDIDADGIEDEISTLGNSSGFLALDKNGDGIINDGTELFGAQSGDGFSDLSAYDEDGNGWIDEADSVFDKLIIWTKDENGNDKHISLKEAGVGALFTGKTSTQFTLMGGLDENETLEEALDNMGEVNAVIKSTGLFLFENGEVGTMQQVDMAKSAS